MPPYSIGKLTATLDMSGFDALQKALSKIGATVAETSTAFAALGAAMKGPLIKPAVYDEVVEFTGDQHKMLALSAGERLYQGVTAKRSSAQAITTEPDPPLPRRAISLVALK